MSGVGSAWPTPRCPPAPSASAISIAGRDVSEVPPTLLHGRYEVLAVVGRGGEGTLVRAVDRRHGRDVALKLRRVPGDPRDAERLLAESRTLLSLRPHSGLPLARDDFFEGDRHVLVMDWVEGVDLCAVLTEHGRPGLPPSTVLRWLAPVAEALTHLHTTDPPVVHGDVKPANLMLTPTGRIVLVDFGVVVDPAVSAREGVPAAIGLPRWRRAHCPTRSADVYGLAATAFALLPGSPRRGSSRPGRTSTRTGPCSLEQALRRGLATNPTQRTATPGELVEELRSGWDAEALPTGVLTFLATDVVSSTRLWQDQPDAAPGLLAEHLLVVDRAVERHGGRRVGDSVEGDATHLGVPSRRRRGPRRHRPPTRRWPAVGSRSIAPPTPAKPSPTTAAMPEPRSVESPASARWPTPGRCSSRRPPPAWRRAICPPSVSFVALGPHRLAGFDEPELLLAVDAEGLSVPARPFAWPRIRASPRSSPPTASCSSAGRSSSTSSPRSSRPGASWPWSAPPAAASRHSCGPASCPGSSTPRSSPPASTRWRRSPRPVRVRSSSTNSRSCSRCATTPTNAPPSPTDSSSSRSGCLVTDTRRPLRPSRRLPAARRSRRRRPRPARTTRPATSSAAPSRAPPRCADSRSNPASSRSCSSDAQTEPGALPLVAHALSETWLRREGRTLTHRRLSRRGRSTRRARPDRRAALHRPGRDRPRHPSSGAAPHGRARRRGRRHAAPRRPRRADTAR